jgi:hypothetical protein
MKKELSEQVWPVENYTDKIHVGIKATFRTNHWLSFTLHQLRPFLERGYSWLKNPTEKQSQLLDKIIQTGIKKLIQEGSLKKVSSTVSVESQWQWAADVSESGYTNVTSVDSVAKTEEAKKGVGRRALGAMSLWRLNNKGKFGQLH